MKFWIEIIITYIYFNFCIDSSLHLWTSSRLITNIERFDPLADEIWKTQTKHQTPDLKNLTNILDSHLFGFEIIDHIILLYYSVRWSSPFTAHGSPKNTWNFEKRLKLTGQ